MESAFGRDLAFVRVRTGAVNAMRRLGAHAAVRGDEIAFSSDRPSPWLVAHEIAHVVQHGQSGGDMLAGKAMVAADRGDAEMEADRVADRVVAGQTVGLIGGQPRNIIHCFSLGHDPAAPPKRPKITGTRRGSDPHIKGSLGSENRKWATFAQIYAAVSDAEFKTITPGDLMRLNFEDLHALDRLCLNRIKRYENLAEQQFDPNFKPPPGAPDVMFGPAANEYKEFREGVLGETLRGKERRMKAPGLIMSWQDVIATRFARRDIGMAIALSWPVAEMIVNAELSGKEWRFGNAGVLRYGYLGESEIRTLLSESVPDGIKTQEQAAAYMQQRIIEIIKAQGNFVPLALARALLDCGDGSESDIVDLVSRLQALHTNISKAIEMANRLRTGSSPLGFQPRPANLIFDWMRERANDENAVYSAYSAFFATDDGTFSHTRAVMEEPVEVDQGR